MKGASGTFAAVVTDTDTYVFGGITLVGLGVGMMSIPWALIVTGGMLGAFGMWMALPPGVPGARRPPRSEPEA